MPKYIRLTEDVAVEMFGYKTIKGTIHEVLKHDREFVRFLKSKDYPDCPDGVICTCVHFKPWVPEAGDYVHTPKGIGRVWTPRSDLGKELMRIVMPSGVVRCVSMDEMTPVCEMPPSSPSRADLLTKAIIDNDVLMYVYYCLPLLLVDHVTIHGAPKELEGDYVAMAKTRFKEWAVQMLRDRLREMEEECP
jgi:hypothetical protein